MITIRDIATIIENFPVTDDQQESEKFIQWIWDRLTMDELRNFCAMLENTGEYFEQFLIEEQEFTR